MKIGFIGIGIMGAPMVGHLLDAGHEVAVNDLNPIPQELLDKDARVVASAREAAEKGDVIIIMVPDTPDVEKVLFGENGVAQGLSPDKIVIDMSSNRIFYMTFCFHDSSTRLRICTWSAVRRSLKKYFVQRHPLHRRHHGRIPCTYGGLGL